MHLLDVIKMTKDLAQYGETMELLAVLVLIALITANLWLLAIGKENKKH